MSQYDPKFEIRYYVCYFLMYYTHITLPKCRCDIDSHWILVSFYWQRAIQVSYAVLQQLFIILPRMGGYTVFSLSMTRHSMIPSFWICFCSILWEQINRIRPNFPYSMMLTKSRLGLLCIHFCKFTSQLWFGYREDFVFAQYLVNKSMEFDQILHLHWPWPHLGWDSYASIFANLQQSYGHV